MLGFTSAAIKRPVLGGGRRGSHVAACRCRDKVRRLTKSTLTLQVSNDLEKFFEEVLEEPLFDASADSILADFRLNDEQDELNMFDRIPKDPAGSVAEDDELEGIPEGLSLVTWEENHDDIDRDWKTCQNRDMLSGRTFLSSPPRQPELSEFENALPNLENLRPVRWTDQSNTEDDRRAQRYFSDRCEFENYSPVSSFGSELADEVDPDLLDFWEDQAAVRGGNASTGKSNRLSPVKRSTSKVKTPSWKRPSTKPSSLLGVHGLSGISWYGWEWNTRFGTLHPTIESVISSDSLSSRILRRRFYGYTVDESETSLPYSLDADEDLQVFEDGSYTSGASQWARLCLVEGERRAFLEFSFHAANTVNRPTLEAFGWEVMKYDEATGGEFLSLKHLEGEWVGNGMGMYTDSHAGHGVVIHTRDSLLQGTPSLETMTWQGEGLDGLESDPRKTKKETRKRKTKKVRAAIRRDVERFSKCHWIEQMEWAYHEGDDAFYSSYHGCEMRSDHIMESPALDDRAPTRRVELLSGDGRLICSYPEQVTGQNQFQLELMWFPDASCLTRRKRLIRKYSVDGEPQGSVLVNDQKERGKPPAS